MADLKAAGEIPHDPRQLSVTKAILRTGSDDCLDRRAADMSRRRSSADYPVLGRRNRTESRATTANAPGSSAALSRTAADTTSRLGQDKDCARSPVPISAGEEGIHDSASVPDLGLRANVTVVH